MRQTAQEGLQGEALPVQGESLMIDDIEGTVVPRCGTLTLRVLTGNIVRACCAKRNFHTKYWYAVA